MTVPGKKPPPDQYNPNIELIELAKLLTVSEQTLGSEHPDTLQSSHSVAVGFYNLGRFEDAVRLCAQTLEIRQRVLGLEHPDTLQSRNYLAHGYLKLGRVVEAVRHYEKTLIARARVLGSDHPDTAQTRDDLNIAYRLSN